MARAPPFVPQSSAAQHTQFLQCLLQPELVVGEAEGGCDDVGGDAGGRNASQHHSVLLDHAPCAALTGFHDNDVRLLPFLQSAVYLRQGSADGGDLVKARCPAATACLSMGR